MENAKLYEFMEKMYTEMQKGFSDVNERLEKLEKGQVRLENELKDTKKTLYDGYIQNAEAIKRLESKIDEVSEKVDRHDMKIQVIEGGRKAL
jgi:DNA-binding ferritin-like protein